MSDAENAKKNQIMELFNFAFLRKDFKSNIDDLVMIHNFIDLFILMKLNSIYKSMDYTNFLFFLESQLLISHEHALILIENVKNLDVNELNILDSYSQIKGLINLFGENLIKSRVEFLPKTDEIDKLRAVNNKLIQLLMNSKIDIETVYNEVNQALADKEAKQALNEQAPGDESNESNESEIGENEIDDSKVSQKNENENKERKKGRPRKTQPDRSEK
ncbi:hypothetical protein DESAMIL20_326 [Desulfurella amilsii]|uniref:Uncharacterized protein n=1 Tax=Desulfurella amilsii TaxID=1562698 RepID=A0A1X4XZ17_9BACT|nr:hypothetical protein [Desulfurella amilsii]OSS42770.1 hypothetical protein DESAMIL20_399 [Desulfurella amilsii]OSS42845.1 hypothetical protein DESAMIL20_326 [Desulfurella amilsii]